MGPRELFTLLGVGVENSLYNARLNLREMALLGRYAWWWRLKSGLNLSYLLDPPFMVCRRELKASGLPQSDSTFGETPLLTAHRLLSELSVGPADVLVDLGSGRGQTVLLAALAFGARGVGLEVLPTFVGRARWLAHSLAIEDQVSFEQRDFRSGPLPEGTLYLLSATCLEKESWRQVQSTMVEAPAGARALVVSSPLPGLCWETQWVRPVEYSWGIAQTYLQRRLGPPPLKSRKRRPGGP
ncbi:hypothetical protein DYH09_11880 [bacterium CPR1]|nr:hypothetical protein [bacterium CPR1]